MDPESGFWWKVIGGVLLFGIVAFVLLLVLTRAAYAWGIGGVFVAVIVVLLGCRLGLRPAGQTPPGRSSSSSVRRLTRLDAAGRVVQPAVAAVPQI